MVSPKWVAPFCVLLFFLMFLIPALCPQVENRCLPAESLTLSGVPQSAQWMPRGRVRIPQFEEEAPAELTLKALMLPLIPGRIWNAAKVLQELQPRWDWNPCLQELH